MKKRQFLAPLAVSVAALFGGARVPAQASTDPARLPVVTTSRGNCASVGGSPRSQAL